MPELTPFGGGEEDVDYGKAIKEFGMQPISTIKNISELNDIPGFKKGLVFAHRDFDKFLDAIRKKQRVSIATGFNASGSLHFGHKLTYDIIIALQKKYNIPAYIPISDDESYVCKKIKDQKQGMKNARLICTQLMALGFDMKITRFFIHQQYTKIYNLAIKLSTKYTLSAIKAIYGFDDSTNPGLMFYPVIQAADILLPQELKGKHHTVTPVGLDQDGHVRLVRDLAPKFDFVKSTSFYPKFGHGLRGGKMSVSREGSAIFLNENPEKAAKLCMQALTGGRETLEEQKKKGGEPEKCIVFEYLGHHFYNEKEIEDLRKKCKSGKIMCGECKKVLAEKVKNFLADFQKKVKKAEKELDKYLLKD